MAEFPSLPLWTDAYLADTMHLTYEEHGLYLMLLIHLWRSPEQRFPNDDKWLARKFRLPVAEVQSKLQPIIAEFCNSDGNWIRQKRLNAEYTHIKSSRKKQSERAKSRWNKETAPSHGNAERHDSGISRSDAASGNALSTSTPTPTPIKKQQETTGGAQSGALADQDDLTPPPSLDRRRYAFQGRVIRLTAADLERWRKGYPNIADLEAELTAADDYYATNPPKDGKWFFAASNWLKRANERAIEDSKPPPDLDPVLTL